MPLRRHPVPHVQEQILRAASGPQLVKARTLAERELRDAALAAERRAAAAAWRDLLNDEINRRVGDTIASSVAGSRSAPVIGDPDAILMM